MLHYNFPPFSTGETKPLRGPGRREIGHGALAERALVRMIPDAGAVPVHDPHRLRDARVERLARRWRRSAAATLSLMDAGVPIKSPGRRHRDGPHHRTGTTKYAHALSDILGDEDHLGDMDFKVCGTAQAASPRSRWTSRSPASPARSSQQALEQAREGRLHILGKMLETLAAAARRTSASTRRASRRSRSSPTRSALIIGPGGKTIKGIIDQTGVAIDVEDDGTVNVASADTDAVKKALDIIKGLTAEPEVGATYKGTVKRITDFGAFVEILPGHRRPAPHLGDGPPPRRAGRRT